MSEPDAFDKMMEGVELEVDIDSITDYTQMDKLELLTLQANLEVELKALLEIRYPRTERGREIHSELTAVVSALNSRRQ